MSTISWPSYLAAISDNAPGARIAERTGIPDSTVSRWFSGKAKPRPDQVVTVARAYGLSPLQGLIAAGYLEEGDVETPEPLGVEIRRFTDLQLAEETLRRIREGGSHTLEAPLDDEHPAVNGEG